MNADTTSTSMRIEKKAGESTMPPSRRNLTAPLLLASVVSVALFSTCDAFISNDVPSISSSSSSISSRERSHLLPPLARSTASSATITRHTMVHDIRDADLMELMVGGQRFEMVPLPDSMMDTTIFVGNLCEFAHDDDLSRAFQTVSNLQSVPACVVRRANMASLEYAFVAFQSVEEKEAAILRFHGVEFMGRKLRVEEIRDDPRKGRVRVPERLVSYVVGAAKPAAKRDRKNSNSITGGMRRVSQPVQPPKSQNSSMPKKTVVHGLPPFPTEKRKDETRRRPSSASAMFSCLKRLDQEEMNRAMRRGFVSLEGLGYGTGSSKSRLASTHRQWCDELEMPQIVHCKAIHDDQLDRVIVDLSPLRITSAVMGDDFDVDEFLVRWKAQIVAAAASSGMVMLERDNLQSSNCERLSTLDEYDCEDTDCDPDYVECTMLFENASGTTEYVVEVRENQGSTSWQPISRLPLLTMGVFEGDRSSAKEMSKQLSLLWSTRQQTDFVSLCTTDDAGTSRSNNNVGNNKTQRQRRERKRENKKRRRDTRDNLDMMLRYG